MSMNIPCINNDANEQFLQPDSQRVEFQRKSQSHWASRCPRGRNKDESSLFTKPCRIHCHGHKSCPFGWKAVAKKEYTPKKLTWKPENHLFEKENHLNQTSIFGFHVNFRGSIILHPTRKQHLRGGFPRWIPRNNALPSSIWWIWPVLNVSWRPECKVFNWWRCAAGSEVNRLKSKSPHKKVYCILYHCIFFYSILQHFTRWWFQIFLIFFDFHPYLGKICSLTDIFRLGWNHQLVYYIIIHMIYVEILIYYSSIFARYVVLIITYYVYIRISYILCCFALDLYNWLELAWKHCSIALMGGSFASWHDFTNIQTDRDT